ncbi:MAG: ABC transporter ATP-binding protein [Cyanobacteria bacterium P01_H01_bin.121]
MMQTIPTPATLQPDVIFLEAVSKQYGRNDLLVTALDAVSFSIEPGELCAIMGPSGSGKSTLMNIIGCLDRPSSGEYWLDGQAIATLNDDQLAQIRNRNIGFIFQQFHLLPDFTALENVVLPMTYAGLPRSERQERAALALQQVGLGTRTHHKPTELSGGQQQRVAIARAIVNNPVLLLADEPTGALDTRTSQEILDLFQTLNDQGMTIVIVTHDPEVGRQCQRTIRLRDGQIVTAE